MIDLRSDTVTRPTQAMRTAIAQAPVGDDVWGDDPTVLALQTRMAAELGMEQALIFPTGTQSNLVGLLSHCQRGDEYIVGQSYHTYRYEGGGAAVLGSIQPQPVPVQPDASLALADIEAVIKADDIHLAKTQLIALENTHSGMALAPKYFESVRALANRHQLRVHLDGARLFNASVALNQPLKAWTQHVDSVSLCFSKGLGAPMGSLLAGSANFIQRAIRWRKVVGGGMRQAGLFAAAMEHAFDHHVARLADDHRRAQRIAEGLTQWPLCQSVQCQTNMVILDLPKERVPDIQAQLHAQDILVAGRYGLRLVVHMDISDDDVEQFITACLRIQ